MPSQWLHRVLLPFLCATGAYTAQPSAPKPVRSPLRNIPWSNQLNFLHTTDTHGWHAGHLLEPSFSADWGDFVSFSHHLSKRADSEGSDLLLVDSGDKVEGNGLYDSSEPKGKYTYEIFKKQHYDIIVCGNHELYKQNTSEAEYTEVVPFYKDNYIASNIDIIHPKSGERVPLAKRFRKFKTKNQGINVLAFGFLFDFQRSSDHAFVQRVEDAVKEDWFQEAIRDRSVDLFVVAGHAEVRGPEFAAIFDEIRKQQWDVPIIFFGGHFHIRDYKKFDSKAFGLASGRYFETIGFQSISGIAVGEADTTAKAFASPTFARRYIDTNIYSLQHHSKTNASTFATHHGKNVSELISSARRELGLDQRFGCAPRNLWTNRAPYPNGEGSEDSVFTWLEKDVLPEMVQDNERVNKSRIILANTGTMRFDIFKGPFTRDTTFIIQPFTNGFRYIADVDFDKADRLLAVLNRAGQILSAADGTRSLDTQMLHAPEQNYVQVARQNSNRVVVQQGGQEGGDADRKLWLGQSSGKQQYPMGRNQRVGDRAEAESRKIGENVEEDLKALKTDDDGELDIVPGYTTSDDAGTDGDDTEHLPIQLFRVPNVFEARQLVDGHEDDEGLQVDKVDVIFLDFVQPWVLGALKLLGVEYAVKDTQPYAAHVGDFTSMISTWVSRHWNETEC